jgi:deaminated glutathione amidase
VKPLKLASICMSSNNDKARNLDIAFGYVKEAAKAKADWVLLPELFTFHGDYSQTFDHAEEENGPTLAKLAEMAKSLNICLFAGSIGERPGRGDLSATQAVNEKGQKRIFNTAYVFDRKGHTVAKYRKTHLFNLKDEAGKPLYCESDGYAAGSELKRFELEGYRVGLVICYDIRFPGLFAKLTENNPIDILVVPSAFTLKTGQAHWELLLRARAVELQSYVFAANQTGTHGIGKVSYGHSMIIDPWGEKIADTGAEPGIVYAETDPKWQAAVRGRLPAIQNRRNELY